MTVSTRGWAQTKLNRVLTYVDERVALNDMKEYVTITVKRRHGGLEARESLFGHQISTKKQFRLIPGAFIISRIQCWHQAFAMVPDNVDDNMIASINYDQFIISQEVDGRFFWWLSHSHLFAETVRDSASGVVIEKMVFDRTAWLEKTVPFPPLDEQRRIVARIEQLAVKIEEARRLNVQAVVEAKALIASSRRHILDLQPQLPLSEIVVNSCGGAWGIADDPSGVAVLRANNITGSGGLLLEHVRFRSVPPRQVEKLKLIDGDIIMTKSNSIQLVGNSAIFRQPPDRVVYIASNFLQHIRVDKTRCEPRFVWHCLMSPIAKEYYRLKASGTSPSLQNLNGAKIAAMKIPIPSLTEQRRVVSYLDGLLRKVELLAGFQSETAAGLDALLPSILDKAFKGQL